MLVSARARWAAMCVFTLSSSINYLDRNLLSALQPGIEKEFGLSSASFGLLQSAFYAVYSVASALAGILIDRIGLNRSIGGAVALWSAAGVATGLTSGLAGLFACRMWLGLAESAVIPANGKANSRYIEPRFRAVGAGIGQLGISLGSVAAPLLAGAMAPAWGWRTTFVVAGVLGFVWIPLWLWMSRRVAPLPESSAPAAGGSVWSDKRVWGLLAASFLGMNVYSLWMHWSTKFLVSTFGLSQADANWRFVWIPPIFAALGGLSGGWISARFVRAGVAPARARVHAAAIGAAALLATAAAPHFASPAVATAAIAFSSFWSLVFSVNLYSLPIDFFGPARAAAGTGVLTSAYGLLTVINSPLIGRTVDLYGFAPACAVVAVLPLVASAILYRTLRAGPPARPAA